MFKMLVDTCVWFDIAKDGKQTPLLDVLEEMVRAQLVTLLVPRIVIDEFQRNRARVEKDSVRSLASHVKVVKDAVVRAGSGDRRTRMVLEHLDDVSYKIPLLGGTVSKVLDRIETILAAGDVIDASESALLRAARRAIDRRAPFHRDKNGMADATLIELYGEAMQAARGAGLRFAFVTHNRADFSAVDGNQKAPHDDFAGLFSRVRSLYFINLAEALRRVDSSRVSDAMLEQSWNQDPRGLTEILVAEDVLLNQVWYNRHVLLRERVESGRVKVVEKETYPRPPGGRETVQRDVWKGALKSARRVERRCGRQNLGPYSDFDWGIINGKLSALRWVLGDEWDMLDT